MYIEGSPPRRPGQVARLISKEIPANFGEHCFTFYYLMSGRHIGYLDLHLVTKDGIKNNLWRKNGHQAPGWINAAVNLKEQDKAFRVGLSMFNHSHSQSGYTKDYFLLPLLSLVSNLLIFNYKCISQR